MLLRLTLRAAPGPDCEVEVDCPAGTTLGALWPHLRAPWNDPALLTSARVGCTPLEADTLVGRWPLLAGAVLQVGPGQPPAPAPGTPDLVVVAGPAAGLRLPLRPGRQLVGRQADLRVPDPRLSRVHLEVETGSGSVRVRDAGSTNGSRVGQHPLTGRPVPVRAGQHLVAGHSLLEIRVPVPPPPPAGEQGRIAITPAARQLPAPARARLQVPPRPRPAPTARFPLIAVLVPLLAAGVLAAVLGSPLFLLFGLLSPVMLVSNLVSDRVSGRARHRRERTEHEELLEQLGVRAAAAARTQAAALAHGCPDPDLLLQVCRTRSPRLWERQPAHPDFGLLRVGTGQLPADLHLDDPDQLLEVPLMDRVPFGVRLPDVGVLGVCGPDAARTALGAFLLAQLAVLHSPRQLRLVLLTGADRAAHWRWFGWLPHATPGHGLGAGARALLGAGPRQVGRLLDDLLGLVDGRERDRQRCPLVVVLIDQGVGEEHWPAAQELLDRGPAAGVVAVCLAPAPGGLPAACREQVRVAADATVDGAGPARSPVADLPAHPWREAVGRALAPLRDRSAEDCAGLPESVMLGDLLDHPLSAEAVVATWQRAGGTARAVLGAGPGGPLVLDLDRDGPHALVAGTTGSGKSELLRTLVTSLALAHPPEQVSFVLVDYKGGAAFGPCRDLPHVVGTVTDLDPGGTARVIVALRAELRRRERLLAEAGADDLSAYRAVGGVRGAPPLARLVVVVDEFRMLAQDHPDLLEGLVSLATLGRSLGLHLVLATQRPAGVVGPEIRANVNLRIALRVQDGADSRDVLEDPAAAALAPQQRGRALLRAGSGALVPVQIALAGAGQVAEPAVTVVPVTRLGPCEEPPEPPRHGGPGPLAVLVGRAAELAGARPIPPIWCPPLPDRLPRHRLGRCPGLALGLADHPEQQTQRTWGLDPAAGNLLVSGTTGSGRRTLARALIRSTDPQTCWVLDGAGGLREERHGPGVGAVVDGADGEHAERVLTALREEVNRRHTGRAGELVLLVVHGWEECTATWDEPAWSGCADLLAEVMRRGPAVGVLTVVTGGRVVLSGRICAAGQRLLLRPGDPADALLAGVGPRRLPTHWPPGRGLLAGADPVLVQLAEPPPAPPVTGPDAPLIPPLPVRLTVADPPAGPGWIGFGRGGARVAPVGWAETDTPTLLVAGAAGSGRSSTLRALAAGAGPAGVPTFGVGLPASPALAGAWPGLGPPPADLLTRVRGGVLLVDGLDRLDPDWEPVLTALVRDGGTRLAVTADTAHVVARHTGLVGALRRAGHGLLLGAVGPLEAEIFRIRLARGPVVPPGRAVHVHRGRVVRVQIRQHSPGAGTP